MAILRDLAERYRELCESDANRKRMAAWRDLNDLKPARPLVFCNCHLLDEVDACLPTPRVEQASLQQAERRLQRMLWEATIGDDRVFYPWFGVRARLCGRGAYA